MTEILLRALTAKKYVTGGGIAAGMLAASSAHGELIVQTPVQEFNSSNNFYFNISDNPVTFSTTDTSRQFFGDGKAIAPNATPNAGITSSPVSAGTVINGSTSFTAASTNIAKNATSYYGVHVGSNYGYLKLTADDPGTFPSLDYTYTLDEIGYQTTAGVGVTIPSPVPEASNFGLMAVATLGVAGLIGYRRRRQAEVSLN